MSQRPEPITIPEAVAQLQAIVARLNSTFPSKKFTLDGRLLGDIGEILVAQAYGITLPEKLSKHHDGQCAAGRNVQIKATMKDSLTFPCDHVPDFYIGVLIKPDGSFEEVYNGPGHLIAKLLAERKPTKNNLHSVSLAALRKLCGSVPFNERIEAVRP